MGTDTNGLRRIDPDDDRQLPVNEADDAVVRIDKDFAVSVIISLGISTSMVLFILESFAHPSIANGFLPLIIGPAGTLIIQLMGKRQKKLCLKCEEACDE